MGIIYLLAIFITYFVLRANGLAMYPAALILVGGIAAAWLVYVVYRLVTDRVAR